MPRQNKRHQKHSKSRTTRSNPGHKPEKMEFEVREAETISQCLDRIKAEGYEPVGRREEPIFQEIVKDGKTHYEPAGKRTFFDAKLIKTER